MHMDPNLPAVVGALFVVLLLGLVLRRFRAPHAVVYLLAGVVLGPDGLGLLQDRDALASLGEFGVLLLLFFVGTELSVPKLLERWRVPVIGTGLQIAASVGCAAALGAFFDWPWPRSLLLGFVISLSSTAVVTRLLHERGEMDTPMGRDVVGVLLVQDVAIAPMLILLGFVTAGEIHAGELARQGVGAIAIGALFVWLARAPAVRIPGLALLKGDHELEVLGGLGFCLGVALLTGLAGLSTALGAFIGGILLAAAGEGEWVHRLLEPFRVVLLAIFFLSIGALVDQQFVLAHLWEIGLLALAAFLTNNLINGGILRALGVGWRDALLGGALLSQLGEFGFVLAAIGLTSGVIVADGYQLAVGVIAATLLLSAPWVAGVRRLVGFAEARPEPPVSGPESPPARS